MHIRRRAQVTIESNSAECQINRIRLLLLLVVKYVQRESPTPPLANARAEQAVIRPWSSGCYRQRQQF